MSTAPAPVQRRGASPVQMALAALLALLLAAILIVLLVDRNSSTSSSPSVTGSGVAATQARSLPSFTGVDLTGANNVMVRVGASQSVVVHADRNLLGHVTTDVESGRLVIGNTPGNFTAKSPMFVTVSVPSLDALTVRGDGNITATGINSQSLSVSLPGSGNIHATGTAARLAVAIAGSGNAFLGQLTAGDAAAVVSGDGTITVRATHSLNATVSGSGTILYSGSPRSVSKAVTGSGTITGG